MFFLPNFDATNLVVLSHGKVLRKNMQSNVDDLCPLIMIRSHDRSELLGSRTVCLSTPCRHQTTRNITLLKLTAQYIVLERPKSAS